jgi:hypothetical protein
VYGTAFGFREVAANITAFSAVETRFAEFAGEWE